VPGLLGASAITGWDGDGRLRAVVVSDRGVCDTTEFLLSVLSRFAAGYVDALSASGDLPISRRKWEQDAEEDLRLRRLHQEQQRQFQAWSGTSDAGAAATEAIPASVDLMQRPDCMDDLVAFASAVASLGPDCAAWFWSRDGAGDLRVAPSHALLALDHRQEDDESLLPCYLSFLSSLALAEGGAEAVHLMLSAPLEEGRKGQVTWGSLLSILRWYTQKLNSNGYGGSPGIKAAATLYPSTSYYTCEDDTTGEFKSDPWARDTDKTRSIAAASDLTAESSFVLAAHLMVLSKVCRGCPSARSFLLGSDVHLQGSGYSGSADIMDQDSTLVILFSLAVSPLPPEIRGGVFHALASLLSTDPKEQAFSKIQESAVTAWQILDQCQILPIYLLDQYSTGIEKDARSSIGLRFPPASMALVSTA
jgi:hypothetical protein